MFEFFNNFTEEEMNKFHKFIISPYHNTNKNLERLYKCLLSEHPVITDKSINKKILFRKIYRTGAYDDVKIRKVISDFYKLTDKFLLQLEAEKDEFHNMVLTSNSNLKYGMINSFKKKAEIINKNIETNCVQNENQYLDYFTFLRWDARYNNHVFNRKDYKYIDQTIANLDNFFISAKLSSMIDYLSLKQLISDKKAEKKFDFMDSILRYIENNIDKIERHHPLIFVKYLSLKMFYNFDDDKYFKLLINYFEKNKKLFVGEILNIYTYSIIFFCNYRLNLPGDILFYQTVYFNTTDFLIKNDLKHLILFNGYITASGYLTSIVSALALKKNEWAKYFIEEFKKYLDKDSADNVYNYANVIYNYNLKNFSEMNYFLNRINYTIPYYYYNSKIYLIFYHFEKNNFVQLDYEIINLRSYCNVNKKITEYQKKLVVVFLKYIQLMIKCKSSDKETEKFNLGVLKSKLDKEKNYILRKNWFYENIEELKKGNR